jgi:hypothetical protein
MKIIKRLILPRLGLGLEHRTTREWRLLGTSGGLRDERPLSLGGLLGVATSAGLALGAGLVFLLAPEARATARRALQGAFVDRTAASGPPARTNESVVSARSGVARANGVPRDSEDADACDTC